MHPPKTSASPFRPVIYIRVGEENWLEQAEVKGYSHSLNEGVAKWIISKTDCILPPRTLPMDFHDALRCPNATVSDFTPPEMARVSASTAIEREIQIETRLVQDFLIHVRQAREEIFADGMDSHFGRLVHKSIAEYGGTAVAAWERVLHIRRNAFETGEELLRQLGLNRHRNSHAPRRRVLTDSLTFEDPRIRDAAGLGLSFLNDRDTLPDLRSAKSRETEDWVREGLQLVIDQLESPTWPDF